MGEEHIRKRHQQLTRCTDAALEEQLRGEDLFSQTPPDTAYEAIGYILGDSMPSMGDSLWEESGGTKGRIVLCSGRQRVVELVGEAALTAADVRAEFGEPLSAVVTQVEPGFVVVRFRKPMKGH